MSALSDAPVHQRNLLRYALAGPIGGATAAYLGASNWPRPVDSTLWPVPDADKERCGMVGIGFGPRASDHIVCCCTFGFVHSVGVTPRGEDLGVGPAIFWIVGISSSGVTSAKAGSNSPRASATSGDASSRNVPRHYRVELGKDASARFRSPRRIALTPQSKIVDSKEWRYAIVSIECGEVAGFRRPPLTHFRQQ